MHTQKHYKVLKTLSDRIFNGDLKPEAKLPPEHELSKEMDVDRTSLRMALKQLELLNVLDIRQGDGIYAKDYMKYAGLDFLRILFPDHQSESLLDEYIIDEILEFWLEFLPMLLRLVSKKSSPRDIKYLQGLYNSQLNYLDDAEKLVGIELHAQDKIAEIVDNMIFRLIMNSSLTLRKKMMQMFYLSLDPAAIQKDIEIRKALFNVAFSGSDEEIAQAIVQYQNILISYRQSIRETWSHLLNSKQLLQDCGEKL